MSESSRGIKGCWMHFTADNSPLPANAVLTPFRAISQNNIWIDVWVSQGYSIPAERYGLFVTDGVRWFEYRPGEHGLPVATTTHMAADSHNRLWLSVPYDRICCFDGQSTTAHEFGQSGFPAKEIVVTDLQVDKLDRVWVATLGHGLYSFSNDDWRKVDSQVISDYVVTFGVDRKSHPWVACQEEKETRFLTNRSDIWQSMCSLPVGLKHEDEVTCFAVDRKDNVWVGRRCGGLTVWDGQRWQRLTEQDCPQLYGEIQSVAIDEFENLWVGTSGGFAVLDGKRWHDWGAIRPGCTELPVSREDLLSVDTEMLSQYVYIGGQVTMDSTSRKWVDAPTGIAMFTPYGNQR